MAIPDERLLEVFGDLTVERLSRALEAFDGLEMSGALVREAGPLAQGELIALFERVRTLVEAGSPAGE